MASNKRLSFLLIAFITLIGVVFARTSSFYVVSASEKKSSSGLLVGESKYMPMRGVITDRMGAPLVTTQASYNIRAQTRLMGGLQVTGEITSTVRPRLTVTDTGRMANLIAPVMGASAPALKAKLDTLVMDYAGDRYSPTMLFSNVTLSQTYAITTALREQKIAGIELEESAMRVYPQGDLAGPLLGFVSLQPLGYTGVEGYYEQKLAGVAGEINRRSLLDLISVTEEIDGATIQLTLDSVLQNYVENRLAQAISATNSSGGSVIVMDSRTGAIYAWASAPGYDPAKATQIANEQGAAVLRDQNISDAYEPGSVMKLLTIAAGLDSGKISRTQLFNDTGKFDVGGQYIYNSGYKKYGTVDLVDVLQESINVVAAQIAKDMTAPVFYDYINRFGFGQRTGIDLAGETVGLVRSYNDAGWTRADLATNSYGQGIAASPLQVVSAINALANDGVIVQPYVVQQASYPNGKTETRRPVQVRTTVSAQTAKAVREMAAQSIKDGMPKAMIPGYTLAGKTGTANWYKNGKKADTTIQSFVGIVPASQPRLTILVKLDEPNTAYARDSMGPIFHDIQERAVRLLGIPPDVVVKSP